MSQKPYIPKTRLLRFIQSGEFTNLAQLREDVSDLWMFCNAETKRADFVARDLLNNPHTEVTEIEIINSQEE